MGPPPEAVGIGGRPGGDLGDDGVGGRQHLQPAQRRRQQRGPGDGQQDPLRVGADRARGPGARRAGRRGRARAAGVGGRAPRPREPERASAPQVWRPATSSARRSWTTSRRSSRPPPPTRRRCARRSNARSSARRFAGRLGIRAVNVGQYLTPGTTVTTLDAMGGTFVDFSLPQEELAIGHRGLARARDDGGRRRSR